MSRNKAAPGTGMLLAMLGAIGLVRGAEDVAQEVRSPYERVDPETFAAPDSVDTRIIARIGLGVILVLWIVVALTYPLFRFFMYDRAGGKDPSKSLAYRPALPPRPRNVNEPYQVLETFRKREEGQLSSYYWVDRSKGVVAIPIDQAIQILARQGLTPTASPKTPNEYYPPRAGSMRTGFEGKVVSEPQ